MKRHRHRRNQWKNYTAATAGLVGTAVGMEASVARADMVQDVNPDITISPGGTIFVDLDQDGGGPYAGTSGVPGNDLFLAFSAGNAYASFFGGSPGEFLEETGSSVELRKLGPNESIGPTSMTWGGGLFSYFEQGSNASYQWEGGGTGFIGARLDEGGGNFRYGWLEVTFDDAADMLTLHSFAVSDMLNTAITTIPEAQSLAACSLALGGVLGAQGIAAYRRRKKELATA